MKRRTSILEVKEDQNIPILKYSTGNSTFKVNCPAFVPYLGFTKSEINLLVYDHNLPFTSIELTDIAYSYGVAFDQWANLRQKRILGLTVPTWKLNLRGARGNLSDMRQVFGATQARNTADFLSSAFIRGTEETLKSYLYILKRINSYASILEKKKIPFIFWLPMPSITPDFDVSNIVPKIAENILPLFDEEEFRSLTKHFVGFDIPAILYDSGNRLVFSSEKEAEDKAENIGELMLKLDSSTKKSLGIDPFNSLRFGYSFQFLPNDISNISYVGSFANYLSIKYGKSLAIQEIPIEIGLGLSVYRNILITVPLSNSSCWFNLPSKSKREITNFKYLDPTDYIKKKLKDFIYEKDGVKVLNIPCDCSSCASINNYPLDMLGLTYNKLSQIHKQHLMHVMFRLSKQLQRDLIGVGYSQMKESVKEFYRITKVQHLSNLIK